MRGSDRVSDREMSVRGSDRVRDSVTGMYGCRYGVAQSTVLAFDNILIHAALRSARPSPTLTLPPPPPPPPTPAVVAFSAIFAPHLPFPSSALFTLYCAIMAMAAYQLAGPLLTWLSVRPAWVDAKPRWAKFLPGKWCGSVLLAYPQPPTDAHTRKHRT